MIACLLWGAATACQDSTAPRSTPAIYVLDSIGGHALPAVVSAYSGDTAIVLWAVLMLDGAGHVRRVEQERYIYQGNQPTDTTVTALLDYRVAGDSITVGYFGGCRDACPPNEVGAYSDLELTLTFDTRPRTAPVYHYHHAAAAD